LERDKPTSLSHTRSHFKKKYIYICKTQAGRVARGKDALSSNPSTAKIKK
jgi:hypothetical protein